MFDENFFFFKYFYLYVCKIKILFKVDYEIKKFN